MDIFKSDDIKGIIRKGYYQYHSDLQRNILNKDSETENNNNKKTLRQ